MSLVTCAGADVLSGQIHLALRGPWWAELRLDTDEGPTGAAAIAAVDGLALVGTIVESGVHLDTAHVRLVGGAGKLSVEVRRSFRGGTVGDALGAILRAAGEAQSSEVLPALLGAPLAAWSVSGRASRALDELARAAGEAVSWRVLPDGKVWMGAETWPAAALPDTADIVDSHPLERRVVLGVETPALLPGVDLEGAGRVVAVDHWISESAVRSWAWV